MSKAQLLYFYEERIPQDLRSLVEGFFNPEEFALHKITYTASQKETISKLKESQLVLFAPGRFLSDEILESASHIKLMQLWSSGFDKFNIEGARKVGIPVANNGGSNATSVAEHTVLLMLACSKWLPNSYQRTVNGQWAGNSHGLDMFTLQGKTIGLIGYGNIGQRVGRIANGFGMRVLYHDPQHESPPNGIGEYSEIDGILKESDFVSLHVHLNDHTRGMIAKEQLEKMKPTATLINVSRSQLVDTDALLEALKKGKLWGAGLDVYDKEPTAANDPLLQHPHVVCTPHMAGSTMDAYRESLNNCLENFRRVLRGEAPKYVVNKVGQ